MADKYDFKCKCQVVSPPDIQFRQVVTPVFSSFKYEIKHTCVGILMHSEALHYSVM